MFHNFLSFFQSWYDDFLRWDDDDEFNGIKKIKMFQTLIWTPQISIITNPSNMSSFILNEAQRIEIRRDGQINWYPIGQLKTKCTPKLRLFPFDSQGCDLHFESWNYPDFEMNLFLVDENRQIPAFIISEGLWMENAHWEIIDNSTLFAMQRDVADGYCYSLIVYRLVMKRRPMFHVINMIVPSIIISGAEIAVFLLPCNDPTRVQISVTCLLAYTVFQSMIMQMVPQAIDSVPLMSLFIDLQMFYIGFIAVIGDAICFAISNSDFYRSPPSAKLLNTASRIGHFLGLTNHYITDKKLTVFTNIKDVTLKSFESEDDISILIEVVEKWRRFTMKKMLDKQWLFIAQVLQRINLLFYAFLFVFTPIIVIGTAYTSDNDLEFRKYESDC